MFRSATFKLTMWYLAIAMAISLLFSIALYHVTTGELNRGLHSESQSLYKNFPVFQGDPNFNFQPKPLYEDSAHRILLRLIGFNMIVLIGAGVSSYFLARRTLEPIELAHRQQARFTADVSHELRTPITAIKMESEVALLNDKAPANELRAILESNLEEVAKLEVLINNLLRLSRLEADELQQNFSSLNSQDIINEAIEKVGKIAQQKSITIDTKLSNASVYGDPDSLVQLLVILLDNAIKYSPKNSAVSVVDSSSKDTVSWKIKDSGIGIEPEALRHVFDRFYRADTSRTKIDDSEGYGLGLSIAKMIADIHNATITLSSEVEKGTTVVIRLPKESDK
jgi:two-component system sensor histidine kinase CiaH